MEGGLVLGEGKVADDGGGQSSSLYGTTQYSKACVFLFCLSQNILCYLTFLFLAASGNRFDLHQAEWDVIEDIYRCPLKLRHFDHLINRIKYYLDFGLTASKAKHQSPF